MNSILTAVCYIEGAILLGIGLGKLVWHITTGGAL
jgi:hypothetical protein